MVTDHCKCSRAAAVKALRNNDGDSVNAILELSNWLDMCILISKIYSLLKIISILYKHII
jgi:hypothetical protein